jgi:restriction system protein
MAAVAFLVAILLPVLWGGGVGLREPWRSLALLVAAGALLVGVSAWPARYRLRREEELRRDLEQLRRLPREQLAELVGDAYRRAGYRVAETGRGVGAGIDLELRGRRGITLVQCRHYRQPLVDLGALSELHAVMRSARAGAGIVVTTGAFTQVAGSYARVHGISMVEGRTLLRMVRVARPAPASRWLASE